MMEWNSLLRRIRSPKLFVAVLGGAFALFQVGGCCSSNPSSNTTTCSITFANSPGAAPSCTPTTGTVSGYVIFGGAVSIARGGTVVIQWSTDSFATTIYTGAGVVNTQGMLAVPFGFSVNICGTLSFQLRAFQDPGVSGVWTTGDAVGRYDGTDTGNATYTTVSLSTSSTSVSNLSIIMDGTGAQ